MPQQELFKGWDCCDDYLRPKQHIRIDPSYATLQPEQRITLTAINLHPDCDDSCFKWRLALGGGQLPITEGKSVFYYAPMEQEECKANSRIDLICGGRRVSSAYFTMNRFTVERAAYYIFRKEHTFRWADGKVHWPDTMKPPPPPWDPPPTHVHYTDDVAFPFFWKPGDDLPPGATVNLKDLFPEDWRPGDPDPPGVFIELFAEFPPDWKPGDEPPPGVHLHTYTLFPEDYQAWFPAPTVFLNHVRRDYDCADRPFAVNEYSRFNINCWWKSGERKWYLTLWSKTGAVSTFRTMKQLPWDEVYKGLPRTKDLRTKQMIKDGCCPAGLYEKIEPNIKQIED